MKRYYFRLLDQEFEELGANIPDGRHKQTAINRARRWMAANGIKTAQLEINSMITDNLLEILEITIESNENDK